MSRFDAAFDRWRDLFTAAEQQRDAARRTMDDYSATVAGEAGGQARHAQAIDQINLLAARDEHAVERLLHLPLPRHRGLPAGLQLPAPAAHGLHPVDRATAAGAQTYLQRPRFLALSEFGPRSLVYHEGRAYRVVRALLSLGHRDAATPDAQLPTHVVRICSSCGAGHFEDEASSATPAACRSATAEIVGHVYRIENVATQPAERITANDEERQRQGFELQTTFEWAVRDQELDVGGGRDASGERSRAPLRTAAGATITRAQQGAAPTRRQEGRSASASIRSRATGPRTRTMRTSGGDPTASPRQWIVPSVRGPQERAAPSSRPTTIR